MTSHIRRPLAVLLVLTALSAGCGGNGSPPAATKVETSAAEPGLPAGFTTRVVQDHGFSIALPKAWRAIDAHAALSAGIKEFRKRNPQIVRQIEALARPNSPIKLLALGATVRGFVTNLNVIVTRIPESIGFDEWTAAEIKEIEKVPTVTRLQREETQLRPGRAVHLTYRATFNSRGGSFAAFVHQYMVKSDGLLYILTYTTLPAAEPRFRDTFADSARSFRLTR